MSEEEKSSPRLMSATVKLQFPIQWGEGEDNLVKEVKLRRPRGKDIKGLGKDMDVGDLLKIAASTSQYTSKFFDEMDAVDCFELTGAIADFLDDGGQQTGKTV